MSEMHEVPIVIRRPTTESPQSQELPSDCRTSYSIDADDANDTNNNDGKPNKNVLKTAPATALPRFNHINRVDTNRRDNIGANAIIEPASRLPSTIKLQGIDIDGQHLLPKTNRSTLNTIREKGQPTTHEDGATAHFYNTNAAVTSSTNCDTEHTHSRSSNKCHHGKSAHSFLLYFTLLSATVRFTHFISNDNNNNHCMLCCMWVVACTLLVAQYYRLFV